MPTQREHQQVNEQPTARRRLPTALVCFTFAILTALICQSVPTSAQDNKAGAPAVTVILFDSSGSMWGKLAGETQPKFLAAKDALAQTFTTLPAKTALGLVTFGRSCSGASVVIPPAADTQQSVINRISNLNPRSKGPIALALQTAAAALPPDTPGTFMLIHDGPDNCRQDPCAVARDIAKQHPRLKINLISVAVTPEAASQMQCVAKETGGKVYPAANVAALGAAVARAFAATKGKQKQDPSTASGEPVVAAAAQSTLDGPSGLHLSASLIDGGPALSEPLLWIVTKGDGDNKTRATVVAAEAPTLVRRLDPGTYTVSAGVGLANASTTVTVDERGTKAVRLALNAGKIAFNPQQDGQSGFVTVKPDGNDTATPGSKTWLGRSTAPPLIAPAGNYRVIYENGLLRREDNIAVQTGKSTPVDLATRNGRLQLSAQTPAGTTITDITFQIRIEDPALTGGGRNVLLTRAYAPKLRLPAGTYVVSANTRYARQSKRIVVGPSDDISETFTFNLGEIALTADLAGSASQSQLPLVFQVTTGTGNARREIARSSSRSPTFALPAGNYVVSVELGSGNVKASAATTVTPDEKQKITLKLDAGKLTLERAANTQGPQYRDVLWEVLDVRGQVVWRTNQLRPTTLLAPGRYTVRNEALLGSAEENVELASGATQVVEVGSKKP